MIASDSAENDVLGSFQAYLASIDAMQGDEMRILAHVNEGEIHRTRSRLNR